jgi:predicted nuclease of restriction endonuclease-like (RecB) superfamily
MNEAADSVWSTRQLDRQISTLYYDRLLASKDKAAVISEAREKLSHVAPEDIIKDPYILEFLNLKDYPTLRETDIETGLISNLQDFMLELGKGFCFVARQKRMRYDDEDFYVDFYAKLMENNMLDTFLYYCLIKIYPNVSEEIKGVTKEKMLEFAKVLEEN